MKTKYETKPSARKMVNQRKIIPTENQKRKREDKSIEKKNENKEESENRRRKGRTATC